MVLLLTLLLTLFLVLGLTAGRYSPRVQTLLILVIVSFPALFYLLS